MVLLERAIGAALFERSARSARSTALALQLADRSREALGALDSLEREVRAMVVGEEGSLRLASFATANSSVLPDVLAAVVAARPRAEVQLDEGEPDEVISGVVEGTLDAAVVFEYDLDPRQWPIDLCADELMAEPLRVALPSTHPLAGAPEVRLQDLSRDSWVCTREDTSGARSMVRLAAAAGFLPRIVFRSNDYTVLRDLVARGLGVAILPALAISDSRVHITRISGWQPQRHIKTLYRKQNTNPLLPVALECLATSCAIMAQQWHPAHGSERTEVAAL